MDREKIDPRLRHRSRRVGDRRGDLHRNPGVEMSKIVAQAERIKALEEALTIIAKWEFDFRGDCVADARRVAGAALDRK